MFYYCFVYPVDGLRFSISEKPPPLFCCCFEDCYCCFGTADSFYLGAAVVWCPFVEPPGPFLMLGSLKPLWYASCMNADVEALLLYCTDGL